MYFDLSWRLAVAAIPFRIVAGRPVNPREQTTVRYGRGELGHWGEALTGHALVWLSDEAGRRWILMVERDDGHGWELPGGPVEPGEAPTDTVLRALAEQPGLNGSDLGWEVLPARYVPDPRCTDEAWVVMVPARAYMGTYPVGRFPRVVGADGAGQVAWVRADDYEALV